LTPTVGEVNYEDFTTITVADLPGLIEGAHVNVGLGHDFLRHIERTKFIAMVIDISGMEGIGCQQLPDGTLKFEFVDPDTNPPPDIQKLTPHVKDNSKDIKLSEDRIKINNDTLLYDYDLPEEEIEEEIGKKSGKKNKKLDLFEIHLPQDNREANENDDEFEYTVDENYQGEEEDDIEQMNLMKANEIRQRRDKIYIVHPWEVMEKLNFELESYMEGLSDRVKLIIANKTDVPGASKNLEILRSKTNLPIFPISALNGENLKPVLLYFKNLIQEINEKEKL
jgi:GTPase involved in cell partitioning and DNA repair